MINGHAWAVPSARAVVEVPVAPPPRSGEQVPFLTAQIARTSNPGGTTAMWVRDRLDGLWRDEDFADWYPRDGRPGLSPAQLATVCVLQFVLGLSDRQAAEAVRCRIDFKYAMAMELDDPGFHHSVLADFRNRLAEGDRADRLLDLALARLKEAGLVHECTTQRTDSTHVLAAVRDLTRLELITEAVRAALEESPASPLICWTSWSMRTGGAATAVRSAWARTPPGPRPGSSPPARTLSGSWNTSIGTERTACPVLVFRPCARSWCRTTTMTLLGTCAGAAPRRKADQGYHHPLPGPSFPPTTPRPARTPRAHHQLEGVLPPI
ncbi:transposase [Streptomyces sp. NPDC048270]|uniref:transposase n=1 Tax=Streptomyces sp. NPDC048270 TaxID=3154615 RepID=UPI0033E54C34